MITLTNEMKAILDLISYSEGTYGISNNGYDVLINDFKESGQSRIIKGWKADTTIVHGLNDWAIKIGGKNATASGRYQFTGESWKQWNGKVNAPMTKSNQDDAAINYLYQLLGANYSFKITSEADMAIVVNKISGVWSSFKTKTPKVLFDLYKRALAKY